MKTNNQPEEESRPHDNNQDGKTDSCRALKLAIAVKPILEDKDRPGWLGRKWRKGKGTHKIFCGRDEKTLVQVGLDHMTEPICRNSANR